MPTFTSTCTNQLASRPNATRLLNESFARSAILVTRRKSSEEEREREQHADEAELLADDGEDEVGVLRRQEREALLRALREALAEQPPGADRDLRLDHVVARLARVDVRVEEDEQALLLVRREPLPEDRRDHAEHDVGHGEEDPLVQVRLVPEHERDQQQEPGAPDT